MEKLLDIYFLLHAFTIISLAVTHPFQKLLLKEKVIEIMLSLLGLFSILIVALMLFYFTDLRTYKILKLVEVNFSNQNLLIYFFSSILIGLVSKFSFQYIFKEIGYNKFFLNLSLFWLGLFLFLFSSDFLFLFAGWELIGISSIFLISFYHYRKSPVHSALYVVSFYKIADIILITSLLFLNNKHFDGEGGIYAECVFAGIVIAGLIKSASFPFTSWLPKSMEGPTPSSAIYYVALSVNVGVLLIVKFLPQILLYEASRNILLFSGVSTIVYSSIQSRIQNNIKSSFAYAASTQIGFVLIELYLNLPYVALLHLLGSSFLKAYQFVRSPSVLHLYHSMEGEYGQAFSKTGAHFEFFFPKKVRELLYFASLNHFYIDSIFELMRSTVMFLGKIVKVVLFPLVETSPRASFKSLMWWGYYLIVVMMITYNAFEIKEVYFDIIPVTIFIISLAIVFEKNVNSFIALFSLYKILESFIVHGVHTHDPYKWISISIVGIFMFLIIHFERNLKNLKFAKFLYVPVLIFLMLYFTNFPFLLQSLVNEHIIDAFFTQNKIFDLIFFCLANTLLNLGLYNFIFSKTYLGDAVEA